MGHARLGPSPSAVFRRHDFRMLFGAQFVSSAGSGLTSVAASILVFQLTGSAWSVGLLMMANALPSLLIGLVAGVFVDRLDRRKIMIAAQVLRAALIGAVPLLMPFGVVWVYVLLILSSSVECFFDPAQSSVLPETAPDEELAAANALMTVSECAALTIGYAGGGVLAGSGLIAWAFWLDAISYLVAAGCIALMRVSSAPAEGKASVALVAENLRHGLGLVRATAVLRSMFLVYIPIFVILGFANSLILPFAERSLGANELEYGLLEAVSTVGFVVGGFVMALYTDRLHAGQWVVGSFVAMGLAGLAFALSPSIWAALVFNGLHGLLNTPSYIGYTLIIQRNTPREARGRVLSAFAVMRDAFLLIGMAGAGLADIIDVRLLMVAGAAALLGCGFFGLRMPGLGQPSLEWRRALRMLRTAPQSAALGLGRAAGAADIAQIMALVPPLGQLTPRQVRELTLAARVHDVPAGTPVVRRDEPSDAAYFLLDGRTVALLDDAGGEILETHAAGDFFGELAALSRAPRTATVLAEQPTRLLQIPAATLRALAESEPFRDIVRRKVAERVQRLELRGALRVGADYAALRSPSPQP